MKRLLFGFAAIIVAAAAAAFTSSTQPRVSLDDAYFAFDYANHAPTLANIEDESKWIRVTDMTGCPEEEERACKIRVSSDYYVGTTLQSSVDIQALESTTNVAFVDNANAVLIVNRSNP